jgi:hypothetical protein
MPNYCENDLYITGPDAEVEKLLAHIGADETPPEFDFDKVIPYPEKFQQMDDEMEAIGKMAWGSPEHTKAMDVYKSKWGTDRDGFNSGGYEWRVQAYGTKWNASDVVRRDTSDCVCVTFQTAWKPPAPVIVALAKLFPLVSLHLEFFEHGMAFCGGLSCLSKEDSDEKEWVAGVVVNEWKGEYRGRRGG